MCTLRNEYPRPDLVRSEWLSLNGQWDFALAEDNSRAYLTDPELFDRKIQVPFAYQSQLSGVHEDKPYPVVWYKREFLVPPKWQGRRIVLHFGAVDYACVIWINSQYAGSHQGGYSAFSLDITGLVYDGVNTIIVQVRDEDSTSQPRGKQTANPGNWGCWYTRVTGIWQSVWLEPLPDHHLVHLNINSHIADETLDIEYELSSVAPGMKIEFLVSDQGQLQYELTEEVPIVCTEYAKTQPRRIHKAQLHLPGCKLWSPEAPHLYDLRIRLWRDGAIADEVQTYFGMREIAVKDGQIYLNNQPYYLRMVLDQGYWPDGIYTPKSAEAYREDVRLIKESGFNGVRKHQKIEDPYFYYYCDQLGLLVWAEMPACYTFDEEGALNLSREWQQVVRRLYNFASIMAWVPINESWGVDQLKESGVDDPRLALYLDSLYYITKALDPYRLVIGNDGWQHALTDLVAIHEYTQDPQDLAARYQRFLEDNHSRAFSHGFSMVLPDYSLKGKPILITEYGGVKTELEGVLGWGYGESAKDVSEMLDRIKNLTDVILSNPSICGYCYTQLTDVEQEVNGLFTPDRRPKAPIPQYAAIFGRAPRS